MGFVQITDGGDAIPADADVGGIPGIAGAVDDVTVAEDEIIVGSGRRGLQVCVIGRGGWEAEKQYGD